MTPRSLLAAARRFQPTLINRNYTRLWYGQATSSLGDAVFSTTLVLWVVTVLAKGKSWAPAAVSAVLLAVGIAVLAVGPFAGVFVDRWDRKRTMLRTDQIRAAIVGLLTALSFVPTHALPVGLWLGIVCVAVFSLNAVGQFFVPARYTVVRDIVTGDADRARAAGIGQATGQTAMIVGPPLAAPLLFAVGVHWGMLFNALSYVVSFLTIRAIEMPPEASPGAGRKSALRADFTDGLRFFVRSRLLVTLLIIAVVAQLGTGAMSALGVFFLSRNLHAPLSDYGYLGTALGVGGILGSLIAGRMVQWLGARTVVWTGLIFSGLLYTLYSRQTVFAAGITVLFLSTIPMTMLNTAVAPLLMGAAPREYMGRVQAVLQPALRLASLLSTLVAGWLASSLLRNFSGTLAGIRFNSIGLIFAVAGMLIAVSGIYARIVLPHPAAGAPGPAGPDTPLDAPAAAETQVK